jgi:hypothetical protein
VAGRSTESLGVMATLESLYEQLAKATQSLNAAAGEIRDVPLEPVRPNIMLIADALSKVFDLQRKIYHHRPELIPHVLWEVREGADPSPELVVRGAFRRAEIAEAAGDTSLAEQLLEFLLRTQPSGNHVDRAKSELIRLRGNHET